MITSKPTLWAEVNAQGDLVIPREVAERFGLRPGARARLEDDTNHVRLHRPVTHLTKVYIEPTTCCNLDCRTCIRNVWNAELSLMSEATYAREMAQLGQSDPQAFRARFGHGRPDDAPPQPQMTPRADPSRTPPGPRASVTPQHTRTPQATRTPQPQRTGTPQGQGYGPGPRSTQQPVATPVGQGDGHEYGPGQQPTDQPGGGGDPQPQNTPQGQGGPQDPPNPGGNDGGSGRP